MKKLITLLVSVVMTAVLAVSASADAPDLPAKDLGGTAGYNFSANDYITNYARTVKSYIEETDNGFRRIEYYDYDKVLYIENYNKDYTLLSTLTFEKTGYIFGGCYIGAQYNYLVWGQTNPDESDEKEVLLIEKYSKDWKTLKGKTQVFGANTYIPFDAGSLRMTETAGKLYIHTSHEMYASDDGLHHQANMTFVVDTATMTVVDSWYKVMNIGYGYVSHSFNQFIITDGEYIYRADHGDAFPRSVCITKAAVNGKITKVSYTDAFPISGAVGDNFTGVSIGGFEMSDSNLLIAGNSADQSDAFIGYYSSRNIFITVTDKNLSSTKIKYLTSYTDDDEVEVCTPHLVKISNNKFLVMWEEIKDYTLYTRLCFIDGNGNQTSDIVDTYMQLSDCKPVIFSDGALCWFVSDTSGARLFRLNPDNVFSDSKQSKEIIQIYNGNTFEYEGATAVTVNTTTSGKGSFNPAVIGKNGYFYVTYTSNLDSLELVLNGKKSVTVQPCETGLTENKYYSKFSYADCAAACGTSDVASFITNSIALRVKGDYTTVLSLSYIMDKLSKPTVSAVQGDKQITLSWKAVNNAQYYQVIRYKDGVYSTIATLKETSLSIRSLTNNYQYTYLVRAVNGGTSALSDAIYATPRTAPVLTAAAGSKQVTLSWTAYSGAEYYQIIRYKDGVYTKVADISGTSAVVKSLANNYEYTYLVKAVCDGNITAFSNAVTVTPVASLASPSLTAKAGNGQVKLSWTEVKGAGYYQILRYKDGAYSLVANVNGTSAVVKSLTNNFTYTYVIKAVGSNIASLSARVSVTPMSSLSAPKLKAVAGNKQATLTWTAVSGAEYYQVIRYHNGKYTLVANISGTSATVKSLANGYQYTYLIKAINGDIVSYSNAVNVTPKA